MRTPGAAGVFAWRRRARVYAQVPAAPRLVERSVRFRSSRCVAPLVHHVPAGPDSQLNAMPEAVLTTCLDSTFLPCPVVDAGHVPEADTWLRPPLYVQNLDELVQLDHNSPRMVPMGAAMPDGSSHDVSVRSAPEMKLGENRRAREGEPGRFVYRPPGGSEGRYNHYDAVAR